jgi:hypothetical protein
MGCRTHGVNRNGGAAVGAILEAHRHAKSTGHFTVDLRFSGTRANGHPAQQVIEVPGSHGLQQLGSHRQAEADHFQHQLA